MDRQNAQSALQSQNMEALMNAYQRFSFERYFARFFVEPARHPWYRKKIELKCRDKALEVGHFLNDEEKDQLVRELRDIIHRLDSVDFKA